MEEFESCLSNIGAYAAVRQRLEEIVIAQQKACEQLQQSTGSLPEGVTWDQYTAVVNQLEEEKQEHAKTRAQLVEAQDKLELALGKVDILRKQIQREKAQFEQTFADLKTFKSTTGNTVQRPSSSESTSNMHLENFYWAGDSEAESTQRPGGKSQSTLTAAQRATAASSCMSAGRQPRSLTVDVMSSCRPGVKTTQVKSSQVRPVSDELSEREIELQQQEYICRLLDSKSSSRRHANAAPRDNSPANQCSLWRTSQPMTTHHLVSHRNSKFTHS